LYRRYWWQVLCVYCKLYNIFTSLRQGGYVFIAVCLFVSRITQKLYSTEFPHNSVERWPHGPRKKRLDFRGNLDHDTLWLGLVVWLGWR